MWTYMDALVFFPVALASGRINLNFHPLKLVSRYRDPQNQVGEKYVHNCASHGHIFHPLDCVGRGSETQV